MADLIRLLPDHVANQIAAGEVVQRPASVVKELLENSVDAESTSITLVVKDAGRTLIQVSDDGKGMSKNDARACFERHATSKIRKADDLLAVQTKGFRGEALASIAAIAQVEMKTRPEGEDLGTHVVIEGSRTQVNEPCACHVGSSLSVRNLFYNVPARRQFLKSDGVEFRHIQDEFHRVALAHPDIEFELVNNEQEVYKLNAGNLRQRIVGLFGKRYDERLVPVEEDTEIVQVNGFVGKPEFARRTRGEQYFFVNRRFIRSNYLNHAVLKAYNELVAKDNYPSWYLFLEVDPATIDINIHPTKTEIKFRDDRNIYAIVLAAVKRGLGRFNIAPTLDFEQEPAFAFSNTNATMPVNRPDLKKATTWRPQDVGQRPVTEAWRELYEVTSKEQGERSISTERLIDGDTMTAMSKAADAPDLLSERMAFQLHGRYILAQLRSGFVVIDQHRAHERVLYEHALQALRDGAGASQAQLFPRNLELTPGDMQLLLEYEVDLRAMGFGFTPMGKHTIAVDGLPAEATDVAPDALLESLIEQIKMERAELSNERHELLARSLARSMSIKHGRTLSTAEMHDLVDRLFACEMPYYTASGRPTLLTYGLDEMKARFDD